jgi:hypothetical protein
MSNNNVLSPAGIDVCHLEIPVVRLNFKLICVCHTKAPQYVHHYLSLLCVNSLHPTSGVPLLQHSALGFVH